MWVQATIVDALPSLLRKSGNLYIPSYLRPFSYLSEGPVDPVMWGGPSLEETSNEVEKCSADREDKDNTAGSYAEANRQCEYVLKDDGEGDEHGAERREGIKS